MSRASSTVMAMFLPAQACCEAGSPAPNTTYKKEPVIVLPPHATSSGLLPKEATDLLTGTKGQSVPGSRSRAHQRPHSWAPGSAPARTCARDCLIRPRCTMQASDRVTSKVLQGRSALVRVCEDLGIVHGAMQQPDHCGVFRHQLALDCHVAYALAAHDVHDRPLPAPAGKPS